VASHRVLMLPAFGFGGIGRISHVRISGRREESEREYEILCRGVLCCTRRQARASELRSGQFVAEGISSRPGAVLDTYLIEDVCQMPGNGLFTQAEGLRNCAVGAALRHQT
jgi:hypothetical protein